MGDIVHILDGGQPLCRFSSELPANWPTGHKWVGDLDKEEATCSGCRRVAGLSAEIVLVRVQKVSWREMGPLGLGNTLYVGVRTIINGQDVVIVKLSHGFRVVIVKDTFQFYPSEEELVEVPSDLIQRATVMFEADCLFQEQMVKYNLLLFSRPK